MLWFQRWRTHSDRDLEEPHPNLDQVHFRYVFARGLSANDQSDFVQYFLPASTESSRLLTGIIQKS